VRSVLWCKSRYGSEFKTTQVVGLVEKIEYIRKRDIGPTQCYIKASFDFGLFDVKSSNVHLSQLKLFVENERQKDPPNSSITTNAVAVVDVHFDASYETQTFDNVNNNVVVGEQKNA
jgi:hypothetical protein